MDEFLDDDILTSALFENSKLEQGKDDDSAGVKKEITRHVSSVISYFTSSKNAFGRQSQLLEQMIFYLMPSGTLIWASPKVCMTLQYSEPELFKKRLVDFIHADDRLNFLDYLSKGITSKFSITNTIHIRMITKTNDTILLELKSKLSSRGEYNSIILSYGREYSTKATNSLDCILDARVENLRARIELARLLIQRGLDPKSHPLLQDSAKDPGISLDFVLEKATVPETQNISGLYCRQCGVTESPEWRKGPEGKKTLCNACGLNYSKKLKRLSLSN